MNERWGIDLPKWFSLFDAQIHVVGWKKRTGRQELTSPTDRLLRYTRIVIIQHVEWSIADGEFETHFFGQVRAQGTGVFVEVLVLDRAYQK